MEGSRMDEKREEMEDRGPPPASLATAPENPIPGVREGDQCRLRDLRDGMRFRLSPLTNAGTWKVVGPSERDGFVVCRLTYGTRGGETSYERELPADLRVMIS